MSTTTHILQVLMLFSPIIGLTFIIGIFPLINWLEMRSAKRYYARTIKEMRNGR